MNFGPRTKVISRIGPIDTLEVLVHCKLTQVHTPLGSGYSFWNHLPAAIVAGGISTT